MMNFLSVGVSSSEVLGGDVARTVAGRKGSGLVSKCTGVGYTAGRSCSSGSDTCVSVVISCSCVEGTI